ncbi:MAG TPA: YCF48-related protein [Thermoanaerobaculia bacterium]|nr:YCF48-related protein [Thermoanaerobaculia bacterium]
MFRLFVVVAVLVSIPQLACRQETTVPAESATASPAETAPAPAEQPAMKAIWEPVPFSQDIELNAISCAGPETCWVAGDKSTILYTADGGKSWQVQLGGDPESTDEDLAGIFFLDAKHGWALTERSRLLATTDGSTWVELGKMPALTRALWFTSPQTGFASDNHDSTSQSHLNRTADGGKTWTRGSACSVDTTIDGLSRKLGCIVRDAQFVTPQSGFMGGGAAVAMGTSVAAFSRTADGGNTWSSSVIPATEHQIDSIHFWSDKDGLVLLASGQTLWTSDGGTTWTGSVNPPAWKSHYASGEGKIIVGVNQNGREIGYSFNGGRNFSSRPLGVPAQVNAITFPDSGHGYFVGRHGMAYRYRSVPADTSSEGMIEAAAPPV